MEVQKKKKRYKKKQPSMQHRLSFAFWSLSVAEDGNIRLRPN